MRYEWRCKVCKTIVTVERSVANMDKGPDLIEIRAEGCPCDPQDYVRIISKRPKGSVTVWEI